MRSLWFSIALSCSLYPVAGVGAQDLERGRDSFPVGPNSQRLVALDIDAGGATDLAVLEDGDLVVYRKTNQGTFAETGRWNAGGGSFSVRVGALDEDGHEDIVVGSFSNSFHLAFGDGSGQFLTKTLPTGREVRNFSMGDFDGNGLKDLVFGGGGRGFAGLILNLGDRQFGAVRSFQTGVLAPHVVLAGDFNGDGHLDFVVWGRDTSPPYYVSYEGQAGGTFRPVAAASDLLNPADRVIHNGAVCDFDHDGNDDVLLFAPAAPRGSLLVVRGSRNSEYSVTPVDIGAGPEEYPLFHVEDLDGDGWCDIVAVSDTPGTTAWILRNAADGSLGFDGPCGVWLPSGARSVATGVFDGDVTLDLGVILPEKGAVELVFSPLEQCGVPSDCFHGVVNPCYHETEYEDASPVERIAVGDFLGDAAQEVLAVGGGAARLFVAETDDLREEARIDVPVTVNGLAVGDVDGDDRLDFVVSDPAFGKIGLYLLDGGGSLRRPPTFLEAGLLPSGLLVRDLSDDGRADIAVCLSAEAAVAVFLGDGAGAFSVPVRYPASPKARAVAAGDVDGDGTSDLVVAGDGAREVSILTGLGGGRFAEPVGAQVVEDPRAVVVRDLDGNGRDDVVVASFGTSGVTVLLSDEDRFRPRILSLPPGALSTGVVTTDLDRDGIADVVVGNAGLRTLRVFRGLGGGEFDRRGEDVSLCTRGVDTGRLLSLATGDVDPDGLPDLVAGGGTTLSVLRPLGCGVSRDFRRGDVDQDGDVVVTDAVRILLALFAGAGDLPCADAGDTNDDGALNLTDAVALLLHLFQGGAPPPDPGPDRCGPDPTADLLSPCPGACD